MTDLHPWQVSTSALTGKLQQPLDSSIVLRIPGAGEEVIRLNKDGFHYRGQFIEDAGEAHRLMVEFLRQGTVPALAEQPVGPTDEELNALWNEQYGYTGSARLMNLFEFKDAARAVLARWEQPTAAPVPVIERLQEVHPFVVRHYTNDKRPSIKGNGFDGLEIGEDRQEAEEFIAWINKRICCTPND